MRAALAAIHHEQALAGEAALAQQRLDALAQALVGQRFELVEERGDEGGHDHLEQQAEGHPQQPGPDPPVGAGALHQPQHGQQQRQAQHAGNQRHLGEVEQPQAEGHLVEAEALLDAELAVQRERQVHQPADQRHAGHQRHAVQVAAAVEHAEPEVIQRMQPAQHGEADQHGGAGQHLKHRQARAGDGVVSGLLVGGERDGVGEAGRHGAAMAAHMAHLARGQPELGQHHDDQRGQENQREHRQGHSSFAKVAR
ncbi:hypothetical protein D3C87_1116520 [compost metagenome]